MSNLATLSRELASPRLGNNDRSSVDTQHLLSQLSMNLLPRVQDRTAIVAVIGLGYVGLPLAAACCEVGFRVLGIDLRDEKIANLNRGESYVQDVSDGQLSPLISNGRLQTYSSYEPVSIVW